MNGGAREEQASAKVKEMEATVRSHLGFLCSLFAGEGSRPEDARCRSKSGLVRAIKADCGRHNFCCSNDSGRLIAFELIADQFAACF